MEYSHIKVSVREKVAWLTLARPPVNIIGLQTMEEMIDALGTISKDSGLRALVIAAEGKAFCAGMDVGDHSPERAPLMMEAFNRLFFALDEVPVPVVAAVNGAALGGGFELVMACDMIVASGKAKLGQPEIKLGFFPPLAACVLPRLVGPAVAAEINLSGEPISAARGYELGLVNKVAGVETFDEELQTFLGRFTGHSGAVTKLCKKVWKGSANMPYREALDMAKDVFVDELMATEDVREGLRAFAEKAAAEWRDR